MKYKMDCSAQRGFLLLEALIAIFVIAVALSALGGMYWAATRAGGAAGDSTTAVCLAQERMEWLKTQDVQSLNPFFSEETITQSGRAYVRRTALSPYSGDSSVVNVRVSVSWEEHGALREMTLFTQFILASFPLVPQ